MIDFSSPISSDDIDDIMGDSLGELPPLPVPPNKLFVHGEEDRAFDERYGFSALERVLPRRSEIHFPLLSLSLQSVKELLSEHPIKESDRVLDAGSGIGRLATMIYKLSSASVRGVELEKTYVELAREIAAKHSFTGINFEQSDIQDVVLKDENIVFLINPCRGKPLEVFLDKLEEQAKKVDFEISIFAQGLSVLQIFERTALKKFEHVVGDGFSDVALFKL